MVLAEFPGFHQGCAEFPGYATVLITSYVHTQFLGTLMVYSLLCLYCQKLAGSVVLMTMLFV